MPSMKHWSYLIFWWIF